MKSRLSEVFLIRETGAKSIQLEQDELEAILYCLEYADEKDDEGIRSSEPEAAARADAVGRAMEKIRRAGGQGP